MSDSQAIQGPELIVQHTGQVVSLTREPLTIGRAEDNGLILDDPQVAERHAVISWQEEAGVYTVESLGEAETFVNEIRIEGPQILRQGDVIRVGDTILNINLEAAPADKEETTPPPPAEEEPPAKRSWGPILIGVGIGLAAILVLTCALVFLNLVIGGGEEEGAPLVIIESPADGSRISLGSEITLQATAGGAEDITVLELYVDNVIVATATSADPQGAASLTVSKVWSFTQLGRHKISAEARTAGGQSSRTAAVEVEVVGGLIPPPATATPMPAEPTQEPTAAPAPTNTPEPGAPLPPQIEYFRASPPTIDAGGCTTLQWGAVGGADRVVIEPDIGGVGTPGSTQVCPEETTTYILTATGPGGEAQASTVVTVMGGLADLVIESIAYDPPTPIVGEDTLVRITIRNIGGGAADAFNWEWHAGPDSQKERVRGLDAGDSIAVSFVWQPGEATESLDTVAIADVDGEVDESSKNNNTLTVKIQVVEPEAQPETVVIRSDGRLDGYVVNDGSVNTTESIIAGNGTVITPTGELIARGFMSFDLSGIPHGATIQAVELRFFQEKVEGNPYGKLGSFVIDHVAYGDALTPDAFDAPTLATLTPPQQPSAGALYTIGDSLLASWVQEDLETGKFQLRLRFTAEADGDGDEDWIAIVPGGGFVGSGNAPQLTVTYIP